MFGRTALLLFLLLALGVLPPRTAQAQEENRAGLVAVYGDGRVVQQCVRFAEETISGYDLLLRSGLPASVEASAIGPTVCSIGGEGCSFPQESCFCRCQGSPCVYWSYWRRAAGGAWRYQALGAGNTRVANGDVEGWRWAEGTTRDAAAPPAVSFSEICGADASGSTPAGELAAASTLTAPVPVVAGEVVTASASASTAAAASAVAMTPAVAVGTAAGATPFAAEAGTDVGAAPVGSGAETGNSPAASAEDAVVAPAAAPGIWLLLGGVVVGPAVLLLLWALLRKGKQPRG